MDQFFVLPMAWNWYEMYLWLRPNEIRPCLCWNFTSMPTGIIKVQTCSLWSFPQICLHTVASSNQQLHFHSQFSLIVLIKPHPTPIGSSHEVLALAHEGMWQRAIAGPLGLTCANVNRILHRRVATGTLVPGKSIGAHWRTTPHQDCALLKIVWQNRFISDRALTVGMRNLYGMRAGQKTVNNRTLSCDY